MQSSILNCCICLVDYDRAEHIPKIVPSCGHTICLGCLDGIFKANRSLECPLDRVPFLDIYKTGSSLPTNISLLQLLDEKPQPKFDVCQSHDDPINLICITDGIKICRYCIDFGNHKGHQAKHINDIQTEKETKIQKLNAILAKFEDGDNQVIQEHEDCKKRALENINLKFQKLQEYLNTKQTQVLSEAESYFKQEKDKISQSNSVAEIKQYLSVLQQGSLDTEFWRTFQETDKFINSDSFPKKESHKENYEPFLQNLDKTLTNFQSLINSIIQGFKLTFSSEKKNSPSLTTIKTQKIALKIENNSLIISPSPHPHQLDSQQDLASIRQVILASNNSLRFTNEMIKETETILAQSDNNLKNINSIKLQFNNSKILSDQDLINLSNSKLWAQHTISDFEFDVFGCKVGNEGVIAIMSNAIVKMEHLKFLKLRLSETGITDKAIHMLANYVLYRTSNLKGLDLRLLSTQVTDESIVPLCAAMRANLTSANSLVLSLSETKITDQSLEAFVLNTVSALKNLNSLDLYFGRTAISENKISLLFSNLKNLSNLKSLVLGLEHTKIARQNVHLLAHVLPSLSNMVDLALYLDGTIIDQKTISSLQLIKGQINLNITI